MTTHCHACGAELLAKAAYCHQCGQPLEARAPAAPSQAPPDPQALGVPQAAAPQALGTGEHAPPICDDTECTLWEGGFSAKAMLGGWIAAALVTLVVAGAGTTGGIDRGLFFGLLCAALSFGGIGLYVMYRKLSVHYQLTSLRFIHQEGLLRRVTDRMEVIDVDDVAFSQGPVQRVVGVGTIKIMSSDSSHAELFLEGIDRVEHVANLIDEARRAERRRRGLFIEAV